MPKQNNPQTSETKLIPEEQTAKPNEGSAASVASARAAEFANPSVIETQNLRIQQLQSITETLLERFEQVTKQQEQDAMFKDAVQSVKFAASAMKSPSAMASSARADAYSPRKESGNCNECSDGGDNCPECQCVSAKCCCFNIMLHRIRVSSLGGIVGLADEGGLALELQIYGSIAGIGGVLYPSLGGHVMVQGKLGGPGSWVSANVQIARVCIPKGQSKAIKVDFEVKEHDKIFKDDIGSAPVNIVLNCCNDDMNIISHEVQLTQGGGGKAVIGMELRAEKVC